MPIIKRKRKRRHHARRFFAFFRKNIQASFTSGNRVALFEQGGDFVSALLQACRQAEKRIYLEFYLIKDDSVGRALAGALRDAVAHGIEVFLIYDYIGCFDTPGAYFRQLEKSGVCCLPFNPPPFRRSIAWFDKRDHRKLAVIDGQSAFVGGVNIGEEYAGFGESLQRWRDLGVCIDGPVAVALEELFRATWQEEGGAVPAGWRFPVLPLPSAGEASVLIVNGGPHHNRSLIRSAFRMAIAGASGSVKIVNPYFVPGPRVVRSLLRAAARGAKVQLILPAKSDIPLVRLVSRSYDSQLLKGGIEIFEREGTVLHAKVMLIDDSWAVIGSANLDQRSFHRNFEVNVIVDDPAFGRQVARMFREDLAKSRRIVIEEHERRSWLVRLLERFCAPVRWLL